MKFGRTDEQIEQARQARKTRLGEWHKWFAWHPTELDDGRIVWLETVERRLATCRGDYGDTETYFYEELGE